MRTFFFFLFSSTLPLLPATAGAEETAAPPSRYARMEATYASGYYQPTREGTLSLNYAEDGRPYSLTLAVNGRKLTARIWQESPSRCGDRLYARLSVPNDRTASDLVLTDFTSVRCRLYVKQKWHAQIDTREADGSESRLELEGDPNE